MTIRTFQGRKYNTSTYTKLSIGTLFVEALLIMLLWNWLMPYIFKLPLINYLQAIGLDVLAGIFFLNTSESIKSAACDKFEDGE